MSEFINPGQKAGVEVWRIESMKPVAYPPVEYGKFYDGDSYIVLKTTQKASSFLYDIFFWLGEASSKDEQGVAAYKTVELDELLGGSPTQHREVQGHESDLFMQCFPSVEYRKGGVASGFKTVEVGVYETRLLHIKGRRTCRVKQVELSGSALNAGDVFVLDMGLTIVQWNGSDCNKKEKSKALDVTTAIKNEARGGKAKVVVFDQGEEPDAFWEALGGKTDVAPAVSDDSAQAAGGAVKLLKVSDGSVSEVATGVLSKDMLGSGDAYIADNETVIYVWIGKGASESDRKDGMKVGTEFVSSSGRPDWTKVIKVPEGAEPPVFKALFSQWQTASALTFGYVASSTEAPEEASAAELAESMAALSAEPAKVETFGDGSGSVEVWRIEDFKPVALEPSLYGQFFAGDSYVLKYTYLEGTKECYVIYYWQGAKSTKDEIGASALIAKDMDDAVGGAATQVRVVMGKEPEHFLRMFKGTMVIHSGGNASAFENIQAVNDYDMDGTSLFHIKGFDPLDTRAVQVEERASSLNSGDCFALLTPQTMFVWKGSSASEVEVTTAQSVAVKLSGARATEEVAEGSEPDAFWEALGGKAEYTTAKVMPEMSREPQLFHASNETGTFKVTQLFDFSQADLEEDDIYLLDVYTVIFLWIGSESNAQEVAKAEELAPAYLAQKGYAADTTIMKVRSGSEPAMFTANFLGWDSTKVKAYTDPYAAKLAKIRAEAAEAEAAEAAAEAEAAAAAEAERAAAAAAEAEAEAAKKAAEEKAAAEKAAAEKAAAESTSSAFKSPMEYRLPYDALKGGGDPPSGVDPAQKEQYLNDDDFVKVLGSPRAEFNLLKPWKKNQLKKAAGLF